MNPSLFSQAIRLRLRDTPIETKHCVCGFSGPTSDMTTHVLGCAKIQGTGVGWRHNVIKYKIAAFCRERLVPTTVEPYLVKHLDNKQSRADLCVTTPNGNLYIDQRSRARGWERGGAHTPKCWQCWGPPLGR